MSESNETNLSTPPEEVSQESSPLASPSEDVPEVAESADSETSESLAQDVPAPVDAEGDGAEEEGSATESESAEDESPEEENETPRYQMRGDLLIELRRLAELATRYPEIGPTVAQLAIKVGHKEIGERLMRAGFEADERGVEYFFLAADLARKEKRPQDAVKYAIKAVVEAAQAEELSQEELNRLPHILRIGFSALMFDFEDVKGAPEFVEALQENLPKLAPRYQEDAFFHTIWAQALWFSDKAESEGMWDKATELNDPESTWNARGTWYKEAEKNMQMAKDAYRRGLKRTGGSALLIHNLAQIYMDEAGAEGVDPAKADEMLEEAERNMKRAFRLDMRRGLRRHMQSTMDRLIQQRRALPKIEVKIPEVGDTLTGRVRTITNYGAFLAIPGGLQGLLHNSEIAHEHVHQAGDFVKVGDDVEVKVIEVDTHKDGKPKVGFSRKALLPVPEGGVPAAPRQERERQPRKPRSNQNQERRDNKPRGGDRPPNNSRSNQGGGKGRPQQGGPKKSHTEEPNSGTAMGSLGELLLHKLEEAKKDK